MKSANTITGHSEDQSFWDHLFSTALAIDELKNVGSHRTAGVQEYMESIEVIYHRSVDPTADYPKYVAVALCRAIGSALSDKRK